MAEFKFVINDVKSGKTYQKALAEESMIVKQIGDSIQGAVVGLEGYELQITGGTDFAGFPMKKDITGTGRKKALLSYGLGMRKRIAGMKRRKTVCSNQVTEKTVQINLKVVKYGSKTLDEHFTAPAKEGEAAEAAA